jgi:hypothetical protein
MNGVGPAKLAACCGLWRPEDGKRGHPAIARHGGKLPRLGTASIKIFLHVFGLQIVKNIRAWKTIQKSHQKGHLKATCTKRQCKRNKKKKWVRTIPTMTWCKLLG